MHRSTWAVLAVGWCSLSFVVDSRNIDAEVTKSGSRSLADLEAAIDVYVENVMTLKNIAGLNLAVVNGDDQLVKGYGIKKRGTTDYVDEDTLFYIASTTKAMTASLLLQTMIKNNISMDTPVKDIFPDFQVADYYRQQQALVGDLLSHRMGIPESFYNWLLGEVITSRSDIVKRALYFKPLLTFRDSNYYSNLFYQAAGLVTEAASGGILWDTLMREQLFAPSQMTDTSFMNQLTPDQLSRLVTPYEPDSRNDNVMREVSFEFFKHADLGASGGSVVSSARDLVNWLYVLTHGGLNRVGERVLDEQVIKDTMNLHNIMTNMRSGADEPITKINDNYGYGWYPGYYNGYSQVYHAGYMFGYHAFATVYPEQKIGIMTCMNGETYDGPGGLGEIHNYISDLLLNLTSTPTEAAASDSKRMPEYSLSPAAALSKYSHLDALVAEARNKRQPAQDEFLDQYVGVYGNFAYGNMTVMYDEGTTRLLGKYGDLASLDMVHIEGDYFVGTPYDPLWFFPPMEIYFARRPDDNVVYTATVPMFLEADPPVFTRGLAMDDAPLAPTCSC